MDGQIQFEYAMCGREIFQIRGFKNIRIRVDGAFDNPRILLFWVCTKLIHSANLLRNSCIHLIEPSERKFCHTDTRPHGEKYFRKLENKDLSFKHGVGRTSDHMARNINSRTRICHSNTESEGRETTPHGEDYKLENKKHSLPVELYHAWYLQLSCLHSPIFDFRIIQTLITCNRLHCDTNGTYT